MNLRDDVHGGYYGYMGTDLMLDRRADKGGILHSRILWSFSHAYSALHRDEYLACATHAYLFIRDHFFDREHGGIYWSVAAECERGKVLQNRIWWVQCEAMIGFYNAYQKRPQEAQPLLSPWKCPYHNTRMCLEMLNSYKQSNIFLNKGANY